MPTLHWVGKDKVVNHHHDVPFRLLNKEYTFTAQHSTAQQLYQNSTDNRIIHGDNLEALKSLLPEFEGKINCIYIDPPYNTGKENWVYNDNVNDPKIKKWLGQVVGKEGEDLSRHDKWLCMMYPRLKLLHRLLASNGSIWMSLDENEMFRVRFILDEVFGGFNFVSQIIRETIRGGSGPSNKIRKVHDYLICYAKDKSLLSIAGLNVEAELVFDRQDNKGDYARGRELNKWGASSRREDSPSMWFPIKTPDGVDVYPIRNDGTEGRWRWGYKKLIDAVNAGDVDFEMRENGTYIAYEKIRSNENRVKALNTLLLGTADNASGTKELKHIFNKTKSPFDYPKPSSLLDYILTACSTDSDDVILDSFAGSGTTAHAVLKLNATDGGNRRFILCEMMDYAETITAERVRRVMNGYGEGTKAVAGLGGGFDYYTVGEPLFLDDKNLNESVGAAAIRAYVAYTESIPSEQQTDTNHLVSPYMLGFGQRCLWVFYYECEQVTTLDMDFLASLNLKALYDEGQERPETYVIYADKCTLSPEFMTQHGIVFKRIPRDITRF